jgi:hypothetical protein
LDFLWEENFPQSNLLQRGGKRPQEERRGCFDGQHNKMRLLLRSSTALWRRVFQGKIVWRYLDFRREGNFSESKLSGLCSGSIRNMQSTLGNRFFALAVFYSCRAPRGCSALRDILLLSLDFQRH